MNVRRVAIGLAPFSLLALVLAVLALQDIYHGEPDLRLEWAMVRIAVVIVAIFHGVAIRALRA